MVDKKNITGIILAGGQSSRMGLDKGLLKFKDRSFIEHIIDTIRPLVHTIIIVSDHPEHGQFQYKRVEDHIKNAGPLAGLYSGLSQSETELNLVISCDVPLIRTEVLKRLIVEKDIENQVVQFSSEGKTMPLIALYTKNCANHCLNLLNQDERRLRVAVKGLNVKTIPLESQFKDCVQNINTPLDLKTINHDTEH